MRIVNVGAKLGHLSAVLLAFLLAACLGSGSGGDEGAATTTTTAPTFATCSSVTYAAPSGAGNNIVFSFDKSYQCGQFANGDWWVSADASGFVKITSITPNAAVGKHGFEVNPASTTQQAFDINADGATYNAALMPSLPLQVAGISSVVKAVSILPTPGAQPKIQFSGVLTVLASPLVNSSEFFRPTYVGGAASKTFYRVSDVRFGLLPKLPATGIAGVAALPISAVALRYAGVRLDHVGEWTGRDIHPKDSMPDYGAEIATENATYLLRLILDDFNYSNATHKQALLNYLQMAIDLQGMAMNGTKWNATGGHSNGRKLPLAFAAWILNNSDFTNAIATAEFDEDKLIYRSLVTGKVLYGSSGTDFDYWQTTLTGGATGPRDVRDPYAYIDGGGYEIGIAYQLCCTSMPWKYTVLAVYRIGLAAQFNNTLLPEYVERWVSTGVIAQPDPCAPFDGNPGNYGITYGPDGAGGCRLDGNAGDGIGRWPSTNGATPDGGFYRSTFGDALWTWHKANP